MATEAASIDARSASSGWRDFVEACALLWSTADRFAKVRLLMALGAVATSAFLTAFTPLVLKWLVDALNTAGPRSFAAPLVLIGLYTVAQYVLRYLTELRITLHGYAEQRIRRRIGNRLFEHLVRMPLQFHLERKVGALGEIFQQGMKGYGLLIQHSVFTVVPVAIELTAATMVILSLGHSKFLLLLAVTAIGYFWAFQRWAAKIYQPSEAAAKAHVAAHALFADSLINHETVKYFDAERVVCEKYDKNLQRAELAWHHFFREYRSHALLVASIFGLSLGLALWAGAAAVAQG